MALDAFQFGDITTNVEWQIQKFWKGRGWRQFISHVFIYRKCT